jgi:UDP-N-acetylglucosamine 2-epimerase
MRASREFADSETIHVFIGTKAQYIKTAPLLRLMDHEDVDYRLIDSGQHAAISRELRLELGIRPPDVTLANDGDIDSVTQAIAWSGRLGSRLLSRDTLRDEVFDRRGGICVVHGDTPSTLLAALMARRSDLRIAHLEAGLRSRSYVQPFPEEIIRIATMHLSSILFAPNDEAMANLIRMGLIDRAFPTGANTSVEALAYAIGDADIAPTGPVVMTMHRVENLKNPSHTKAFVDLARSIADRQDVVLVLHGPTALTLERLGALEDIQAAGVRTTGLLSHTEFIRAIASAPLVVTDGGSVQEECALLGVPTLLWRGRSERSDGIGENVVLSRYRPDVAERFLGDAQRYRRKPKNLDATPSKVILDVLRSVAG